MGRISTLTLCERNVSLDGVPFDRSKWPLIIDILDTIDQRPGCFFLLAFAVQTLKSLVGQLWLLASFHRAPGPSGWYSPSKDSAREFAEEKLNVLYDSIAINRYLEPNDKNRIKTLAKHFPHMSFVMLSAGTKVSRNSKTLKTIVCDEAWMYERGELTQIIGRMSSFVKSRDWRMILPTSCWDDDPDDECEKLWRRSDQRQVMMRCSHAACGKDFYPDVYPPDPYEVIDESTGDATVVQPPGGLHYDSSEAVRGADGRILKRLFDATVYYECPHCGGSLQHLELAPQRYEAQNPDADDDAVAWMGNALCFRPMAPVAFLRAQAEDAFARGDAEPLEDFDRKQAIRPWNPMRLYKGASTASALGNYELEQPWEDEFARFMAIDVQQGYYWWLIRVFSRSAQSRLYALGRAWSGTQLRDIQLRFGVRDHGGDIRLHANNRYYMPNGFGVVIDGNYDPDGHVKALAAEYHWVLLKGEDTAGRYKHKDGKHRIWNEISLIETFSGRSHSEAAQSGGLDRYVAEIRYSPNEARSIMRNLKSVTKPAPMHTYAKGVAENHPEYLKHMAAWRYYLKRKNKTTEQRVGEWRQVSAHDDYEWCERACIVLASTAGLIGLDEIKEVPSEAKNDS